MTAVMEIDSVGIDEENDGSVGYCCELEELAESVAEGRIEVSELS